MDFSLSTDQQQIKQSMFEFAHERFNHDLIERDKNQLFERKLWRLAGEKKVTGLCIPQEYGGLGYDPLTTMIALEAFAEGCEDGGFCFAISAHLFASTVPILQFGTKEQQRDYLPKLCDGTWIAANAMTEVNSGSDAFNMASTATMKSNADQSAQLPTYFELNGHKPYVSNGPNADIVLAYVNTNKEKGFFGGISCFILRKDEHSFIASNAIDKLGVRTCPLGEVSFDQLNVDSSCLLGKVGAGGPIFNHAMIWERVCLSAIHLGTMSRLLKRAMAFTKARQSGGQAIGAYQNISHSLAELHTRLESVRLLAYQSAWKLGQSKNASLDASMTKLAVSELFQDFALSLCEIYAAQGYVNNHEVQRIMRDALGSKIYSGTSDVQKNIIAKLI